MQPLAFDWLSQESRHLVLMIDMNPGKLCQHHVQYNRLATGEFLPWVLSEIPLLLRGKCLKVRFRLCFMRSYDGLICFWSTGIETRRPQTASTCAGAWFKGCCWKTVGTSTHVWCLMSAVRAWTTRLDLMEVPNRYSPSMTLPISRKEGTFLNVLFSGAEAVISLVADAYAFWLLYIHLRLSWVRRSSAEVWEKGWSKSIQSDGEQNRIWNKTKPSKPRSKHSKF